jgi:heat shock protein HslJ
VAVVLQGTVTFRIEGDQLTLLNGDNGLVLTAAAEA